MRFWESLEWRQTSNPRSPNGSRLIQRDDDKPDVIRNRLEVYHKQTEPLVDYYDQKGLMRRIDGTRSPDEVHDHIRAVIATLRLEDDV